VTSRFDKLSVTNTKHRRKDASPWACRSATSQSLTI